MGKDLHPSILKFFYARMTEHDAVSEMIPIQNDEDYVFEIRRARFGDSMKIWLSDAYHFTEVDFYNKPSCLMSGDYIVIAKPEGGFLLDYDIIKESRIGVGQLRKFMGAVNLHDSWRFLTGEEREKLNVRSL